MYILNYNAEYSGYTEFRYRTYGGCVSWFLGITMRIQPILGNRPFLSRCGFVRKFLLGAPLISESIFRKYKPRPYGGSHTTDLIFVNVFVVFSLLPPILQRPISRMVKWEARTATHLILHHYLYKCGNVLASYLRVWKGGARVWRLYR